jgi:hypothetical protein
MMTAGPYSLISLFLILYNLDIATLLNNKPKQEVQGRTNRSVG